MRLLKRIVLAVVIGTLLLGGLLYVYLFQLGGVERLVNDRIASLVEHRYNLEITISDVKGDFFSGLVLEEVAVYYVDSAARYQLLDLPRLSTAYSLSNLWNKKYVLDYLYIDSATVTLVRDGSGRWLIPDFALDSAAGKSALGEFSIGDFGLNHVSVRLLDHADTVSFDNINLSVALQGSGKTYSADMGRLEFRSNKEPFSLTAAGGKLTYSEGMVVFKDIAVIAGDTRVKLDGYVKPGDEPTGQIKIALDNLDLADVSVWLGKDLRGVLDVNGTVRLVGGRIEGSADIAGDFMRASFENFFVNFHFDNNHLVFDTLYGTILGSCTIDGGGEIDFSRPVERYALIADIKNFDLKQLIASSYQSDLTGRVELQGESFSKERLLLSLRTELHESTFDEYPIHRARGDLTITTDSICFADSFRVEYFENIFYLRGRIDYSDDIDLTVAAELRNLDRYKGKLFIDQPGGRGHAAATISGRTSNPDLRGVFISDSVWVYGLYSGSFAASIDMKRFLTGKQGTAEISFNDGAAWNLPYDTGYARLLIDSNLVRIDSAALRNEYSQVSGSGMFDYGVYPMPISLDTLTLAIFDQTFHNHSEIEFDIDSSGFNFLHAAVGNSEASVYAEGRVNYDESMDLALSVERTPVGPWLNLFDTSLPVNGYLSCEAQLRGTFLKPQFRLSGSIDSLMYRNFEPTTLVAGLRYDNRLLTLDSLLIYSTTGSYRATGSFHADLGFTSSSVDRFPELPMDVNISAADRSFELVSLAMPSVEQLDGDFFADITLSGTPHAPHLEGEAYIKNVRLKYFDLEQPIFADSAGMTMKDNKIIIERIDVYAKDKKSGGRKRHAYIEGEIIAKSLDNFYYDLDINLPKEFPFAYELEDIRGEVEGELHIEGDTPPLVTGDLTVISAKYQANFGTEEEGSLIMQALSGENAWDLNINIDILSNYWIKNDDINAEFSGQMNFIREKGAYRLIGEMEILRGQGFLFDKTFRLEPGSRVIFEGNETLNPRLDIIGYTRIAGMRRSTDEELETAEQLEVGIHVTGTLETPEINPVAESGFARDDILPLIVANYYSSDTVSSSGQIEHRLSGLISSQVSQIGARQLGQLGVETFEIDHLYGGESDALDARVTVGFHTAPNLYVYGRSTISGQSKQEVGFEYRFNKAFLLEGLRDEQELYHLALKLHWEF